MTTVLGELDWRTRSQILPEDVAVVLGDHTRNVGVSEEGEAKGALLEDEARSADIEHIQVLVRRRAVAA